MNFIFDLDSRYSFTGINDANYRGLYAEWCFCAEQSMDCSGGSVYVINFLELLTPRIRYLVYTAVCWDVSLFCPLFPDFHSIMFLAPDVHSTNPVTERVRFTNSLNYFHSVVLHSVKDLIICF